MYESSPCLQNHAESIPALPIACQFRGSVPCNEEEMTVMTTDKIQLLFGQCLVHQFCVPFLFLKVLLKSLINKGCQNSTAGAIVLFST